MEAKTIDRIVIDQDYILFGDYEDISEVTDDQPSSGGTIMFTLKGNNCKPIKGNYLIRSVDTGTEDGSFIIIHLEGLDTCKIVRYLEELEGNRMYNHPHAWSRYDWCHRIYWPPEEDSDSNLYFGTLNNLKIIPTDCIQGDWYYGLRLVNEEGESFVHILCDPDLKIFGEDESSWDESTHCNLRVNENLFRA